MLIVSSFLGNFYLILIFIICVNAYALDDFSNSGEFYYNNFVPFHSSEVNQNYGGGGYVLESRKGKPNHHIHCFEVHEDNDGENVYRNWPILNKFKKVKPAPRSPKLDDFDTYYGPQPITTAPFLDDDFDDGYSNMFNDGEDGDGGEKKEKVPFEICYMDCPAPNEGKQVCGDDGKTYENIHKLNCAVRCGLRK